MELTCSRCEEPLVDGQPVWSVTLQKEVFRGEGSEILESVLYYVFCEACAEHVDFDSLELVEKEEEEADEPAPDARPGAGGAS